MSNSSLTPNQMDMIHFNDDDEEDNIPSTWETFSRKFKEQPLVPIGAGATTIALVGAARAIQRGESSTFNRWCRYRIVFQGLTLVAALGGTLMYKSNNQQQTQAEKARILEAQERERIRQRDLRIQAQETAQHQPPTTAEIPSFPAKTSDTNPLFLNQNTEIRKSLLERKRAEHQTKPKTDG